MTTLSDFVVIKRLSVRNLQITPKQVKAEYCVEHLSGATSSCELIYSYERTRFEPEKWEDRNIASLMVSQVALNYGLFCRVIELHGVFDEIDRRFLGDMLENTSREILTNKMLVDNEFILPEFKPLKVQKTRRFTRAELRFIPWLETMRPQDPGGAPANPDRYAILSSGGKDSLLTYGIIKEIGEPYPVFINEAGRHWFTAVNACNYFRQTEPNTEKPWCTSDRVFNWMLRQLPFIRKDFASVRADIYPIRLWTVAVFLFGVLPVVRKEGIGNILIGNEYDTTVKGQTCGISHYSGLFDQSKYFDKAMTRYFHRKGWGINQCSLLRSMSELLIMKMLTRRYPDLQQHQVSCHAAHKTAEGMRPCGRCEKCRRIIGMIKALDGDPLRCGYTEQQVKDGLAALETHSVKQIGSDASHLYYLLRTRGLIARTELTERIGKAHHETTKLRFSMERSNLEDLPPTLRAPLFSRLLEYADGAVMRLGREWQDIVINETFLASTPYHMDKQ